MSVGIACHGGAYVGREGTPNGGCETRQHSHASIERRERAGRDRKAHVTWRVRWRDPAGRQRARSFNRRVDAERHRSTVAADIVRGQYIDPDAGKVTFERYAKSWLAAQTFDAATGEAVALRLRLHAFPVLGPRQLREVKPSTVQAWLRGLTGLAATYQRVIFANVSTIFAAAVDDELLGKNPCRAASVRRPRADPSKVVPWEPETVLRVRDCLPDRYRVVATLVAGLDLRQGEAFALSPEDVDFLRGRVEISPPGQALRQQPPGLRVAQGQEDPDHSAA